MPSLGAQTERPGDARPVSALLGGMNSPAALLWTAAIYRRFASEEQQSNLNLTRYE